MGAAALAAMRRLKLAELLGSGPQAWHRVVVGFVADRSWSRRKLGVTPRWRGTTLAEERNLPAVAHPEKGAPGGRPPASGDGQAARLLLAWRSLQLGP